MEDAKETPRKEQVRGSEFKRIVSLLRVRTGITEAELSDKDLVAAYDKSHTLAYIRLGISCQDFSRAVSKAFMGDKDKFKKTLAKFAELAKQR